MTSVSKGSVLGSPLNDLVCAQAHKEFLLPQLKRQGIAAWGLLVRPALLPEPAFHGTISLRGFVLGSQLSHPVCKDVNMHPSNINFMQSDFLKDAWFSPPKCLNTF